MLYVVRAPIIHDGAVYAPGAEVVLDEAQAQLIPWAVVKAAHGADDEPHAAVKGDEVTPDNRTVDESSTAGESNETPHAAEKDDNVTPDNEAGDESPAASNDDKTQPAKRKKKG